MITQSSKVAFGCAVLLLALMSVLAGGAARRESVTVDEIAHIGAGVSYLQKLDMRLNEEHPPLAKVIAALPLVMRGVHADYSNVSWTFSLGMFKQYLGEWVFGHWLIARWNDTASTVFWARMPMLLLTVILGFVLYIYGSRLGGPWGGLLCVCSYSTMPAILTFGPLVLTDIAVTLFSVLTLWTFATMWRTPSRKTVLWFGLALAGALLSKFSAGLLFFCFGVFILTLRWRASGGQPDDRAELRLWRRTRWRALGQGTLLAALTVYLFYLVLSWNEPSDSLSLLGHNPFALGFRRVLMPPWLYLRGVALFALGASRLTYILGHAYPHGVWFYFPVVFALKSSLAFLLILLLGVVASLVAYRWSGIRVLPAELEFHWRAVWVFLGVIAAACILGRFQISIRHFSIPLVLMVLLLAPVPRLLGSMRGSAPIAARVGTWLLVGLSLASVVTAVRAYPHYLPFLNSLAGAHPGYFLVNDSNLDWNHALPEAEEFVQQRNLKRVLFDVYALSDPTVYVPQAEFWNCQEATAKDGGQWAVVSANMIEESHNCLWLMNYPHQELAGGSMYAFQLPDAIPPAGTRGGPPLPADYHNFAGMPFPGDFRLIILNCVRDPQQLQPTMDRMVAMMKAEMEKRRNAGSRQ